LNGRKRIPPRKLKGVIIDYRKGLKTQKSRECLISFSTIETVSGAGQLIGRKVAWPIRERQCKGKIVALHGKKGLVRAIFKKGVPGQALGHQVEIIG
jgi:large subunit ribosomal protein L35Ae